MYLVHLKLDQFSLNMISSTYTILYLIEFFCIICSVNSYFANSNTDDTTRLLNRENLNNKVRVQW